MRSYRRFIVHCAYSNVDEVMERPYQSAPTPPQGTKERDAGSGARLSLALLPALDDRPAVEGLQGHHLNR